MEFKDYLEAFKGFYKMGFALAKTTLDMVKVAMDSYVTLYEYYIKTFVPTESYESIKKTVSVYMESQAKVFENFKKLLESFEKQQDEMLARFTELTEKTTAKK